MLSLMYNTHLRYAKVTQYIRNGKKGAGEDAGSDIPTPRLPPPAVAARDILGARSIILLHHISGIVFLHYPLGS